MPPSGFNDKAVSNVREFLRECCNDLQQEVAEGKHESFREGVRFEIGQITRALNNASSSKIMCGTLDLTLGFYIALDKELANCPNDIVVAIDRALMSISDEITGIHIDPAGNFVKR